MSARGIAIGIGCRRTHPSAAIVALVRRTLAAWPADVAMPSPTRLCTLDLKQDASLQQAAATLDLPLVFLPIEALRAAEPRIQTPSAATHARFGIASVSEAAALALAGPRSKLIVPRQSDGGATCAIAATLEPEREDS